MTPLKWLHGLPMPYYFLSLALLLCLLPGCFRPTLLAQGTPPPSEGLTVGQRLPGNLELEMVNYPAPTARLSDFKGKLLILDFYGTWCAASRKPMPRLDSLQREFNGKLQILLVNSSEPREKVEAFFTQYRGAAGSRYSMPSVVNDSALINLFPHLFIPHFAWIGPDGTVGAITSADEVNANNIRQVLTKGVMPASDKKDIDLSMPLFAGTDLAQENMLHYTVLLKGRLEGAPTGMRLRRVNDTVTGAVITNLSLLEMYNIVKRHLYPAFGGKGLVLADVDSALLLPEKSALSVADWKSRHTYSYDLLLPPNRAKALYHVLLEDLNRYSGYTAALELQEIDCLLLVRKGRKDRLKSKGGEPQSRLYSKKAPSMQNMPLTALVSRLNSNSALPLLVVDETGYTGRVDMEIPSGFSDLPALRKELQAYGLDLVPDRKKVPLLVLRKQEQTASANTSF